MKKTGIEGLQDELAIWSVINRDGAAHKIPYVDKVLCYGEEPEEHIRDAIWAALRDRI